MSNTDQLGPEYHHHENKQRLRNRRFVWSRRKSSPWGLTILVIGTLVAASCFVAVTYLVTSHPGAPEPNPGIEMRGNGAG